MPNLRRIALGLPILALAGLLGCGTAVADAPLTGIVDLPSASTDSSATIKSHTEPILAGRQGLPASHPFLKATLALADCDLGPNAKTRPAPELGRDAVVELCVDEAGWYGQRDRLGDDGKPAVVTLLRVLHDEDVRIRRAAAYTLVFIGGLRYSDRYDDEPELVDALLTAAQAERDPIAGWIGKLASNVPSDFPGVFERQKRLVTDNPTNELRVTLLSRFILNESMLAHRESPTLDEVMNSVASMATDHPDPKVRLIAVVQMSLLPDDRVKQACGGLVAGARRHGSRRGRRGHARRHLEAVPARSRRRRARPPTRGACPPVTSMHRPTAREAAKRTRRHRCGSRVTGRTRSTRRGRELNCNSASPGRRTRAC